MAGIAATMRDVTARFEEMMAPRQQWRDRAVG
jgi:hypothetical protein